MNWSMWCNIIWRLDDKDFRTKNSSSSTMFDFILLTWMWHVEKTIIMHIHILMFPFIGGIMRWYITSNNGEFFCWQVKWVRFLYDDFSAFTKDQERLISINGSKQKNGLDYLEGMLLMHQGPINNWRSSFFPLADHPRIISLVTQHKVLYCLEVAKYYDDQSEINVDKVLYHLKSYFLEHDVFFKINLFVIKTILTRIRYSQKLHLTIKDFQIF